MLNLPSANRSHHETSFRHIQGLPLHLPITIHHSPLIKPTSRSQCHLRPPIHISSPAHDHAVVYIPHGLGDSSYIYAGENQAWYSPSDKIYPWNGQAAVVDPESVKQQISTETQEVVERIGGTNYPFRLSALAPRFLQFYPEIVPRA